MWERDLDPSDQGQDNEPTFPGISLEWIRVAGPQFLHEVSAMRWAVLIAFTLFAVCSFAQETSPSTGSSAPAQMESKPDTKSSAKNEDPIVNDSRWHLHLGTVSFGADYSHFSSPLYSPYGFYPYSAYYSGMLWNPYWGYLYPTGYFSYNDGKGEIRLAAPKQANVYIDNAYAGKAEKLKSIWLKPGAHDLSVSNSDHVWFHQRIYVLSGKSLKIEAKLEPQTQPPKAEEKP